MKHRMSSRMVFVFLAVLVSSAVLGGCSKSDSGSIGPATASVLSAATPTAGLNRCAGCHTTVTADWLTSKHANLDPAGNLYSAGVPTIGQIGSCTTACHDPNGDSNNLTAGYTGNVPRPVVGCEACHGPGSLHADAGGAGPISLLSNTVGTSFGTVTVSGQFVTCTGCHGLLDTSTGALNTSPTHSTGTPPPTGDQYVITDTHFATPGNWSGGTNSNDISGYAMNYASETVCTDCHNPHKNADINRDWANSKHADKLAADAWAHYNWSCDAANCGSAGSRTSCQRCHTTTGFAAYADALGAENQSLAETMRNGGISLVAYDPNFKPEMLKCTGCHTDNRGNLRNPGAYNATYAIGTAPNAVAYFQYPDLSTSNVCIPCHTGRVSGTAVHNLDTGQTATVDFSNLGFTDGHYLTAGGTMFKGTPYEYAGRNYVDPASYKHNQIGTPNAPNTGSNGPCVGCHMDRTGMSGNHLFEPISMNSGTIIVSSGICFTCHAGSSIDFGTVVQDEKDRFESALQALQAQLAINGYTFTADYPYFATINWLSAGDADTTGNTTGKNNLGAAFNFSLLTHESGAYVHNSRFVKRLIYDSLDWLDDGIMNYSVGATLSTACSGGTPPAWCQGAKEYLLPSGLLWNGTYPNGYGSDAERP